MMTPKVLVLPKANIEVELKPAYLKDLFEGLKIVTSEKSDKLITSILALSMKRLGSNQKVTSKDVDNLSMKDIMYLQEQTENIILEGTIDTDIELTCVKCNKDFDMKLNVFDPSFFVLTKESTTSST